MHMESNALMMLLYGSDGNHVGSARVLIGQMAARRFQLASSEFDPGSLLCGLISLVTPL